MRFSVIMIVGMALGCFDAVSAQSDQKAIEIADAVLEAMGGQKNYDNLHHLQWNFLGRRLWLWDKWSGNVRCDIPGRDVRIAMNINDKTGHVFANGEVQTSKDSLDKYLDMGYRMWINDSYWLVMPFKLRDPGVTLKHLGQKVDAKGNTCEVLEMTFSEVGVTPDNKYWVYVDPSENLVVQWDYFRNYSDEEPRISNPWEDYKEFDGVLLSSGRGTDMKMGDIAVYNNLPNELFKDVGSPIETILNK